MMNKNKSWRLNPWFANVAFITNSDQITCDVTGCKRCTHHINVKHTNVIVSNLCLHHHRKQSTPHYFYVIRSKHHLHKSLMTTFSSLYTLGQNLKCFHVISYEQSSIMLSVCHAVYIFILTMKMHSSILHKHILVKLSILVYLITKVKI